MSDGGKGSTPRPFSVTQEEYAKRWDMIFQRDLPKNDNTGVDKNEFQDILSTEDCFYSEIDKLIRYNEETQQVKN
jgi:hypothetical protein